jgi:hypothetical protein
MRPDVAARLRAEIAAAKTQREIAAVEAAAWLELRSYARDTGTEIGPPREAIGTFFASASIRAVEDRRALFMTGDLAEPLWPLLEADLTLTTAVLLIREAKAIRIPPETLPAALRRAIAEYYSRPYQRELGGGKVTRFTTPTGSPGAPGRPSRPRRASNGSASRKHSMASGMDVPSDFWKDLRSMCLEYATRRLPGHMPEDIEDAVRTLETDVKVAFEQYTARLRRAQDPMRTVLSRRHIAEACRVLLIDPPKSLANVPRDYQTKAQGQFKRLAREYHPDTHGGSESTRRQYEAVVAAWNTLREFFRTGLPKGAET